MKKLLLILLCIGFVATNYAQNYPYKMNEMELRIEQIPGKVQKQQQIKQLTPSQNITLPDRNADAVIIINIDTSSNAYVFGYSGNKYSILWTDPVQNTATIIYRNYMLELGYHISKDGGLNWANDFPLINDYESLDDSVSIARDLNHSVYNPFGSENPDSSYVTYIVTATIDDDALLSGYIHGVGSIGDTSCHPHTVMPVDSRFFPGSPSGYDLTSEGKVFVVDANEDWTSGSLDYLDSLLISKGIWDDDLKDFTYTPENLEALVEEEVARPVDYKVAFGPDGQTGYIVMLADNGEADQVEGFYNLYPIYWKTTDGGDNWTGPEEVQLDGPNGVATILESHLTDNQLEELYGSSPPARDEISYTTSYDCEIAVDKDNRLHIAVVIGPTGIDPYSIITAPGFIKAYDIFMYSEDEPFCGAIMGSLRTFRDYFGDFLSCDNRIQMTTNPEHDKFFISWLDTDLEEEEENKRPNIWCRGFDPYTSFWKTVSPSGEYAPTNVTNFSDGMWEAYFATAPKYTFAYDDGYTIPYVFMDMDPMDESQPVQFKYIQDFKIDEDDWPFEWEDYYPCGWVGQKEFTTPEQPTLVLGNYPNPFRSETTIQLELDRDENISVTITSLTGQRLVEKQFGKLENGYHELQFKLDDLPSGIYFYTLNAGNERVTRKMLVE